MYVVIDSNIWLSELGLSTAKGLALQFFVKQQGAIIAIPEVVKKEVEIHIREALTKHCNDIKKSHRQLLSIFGTLKEVVLPDEQAIEDCVTRLFEQVSADRREIPFSIESANQSLDKVIISAPPNGPKNQQFKDGVIWADCMALLDTDDVSLVTNDGGFYQSRQKEKGLAASLKKEAAERPHQIDIFYSITDLLEKIQEPVDIDEAVLVKEFTGEVQESISTLLINNGFETSGEPILNVSSYITENTDHLFIEFEIAFNCNDITDENRTNAILTLKGDAKFHVEAQKFSEFRNLGETLDYIDSDGEQQQNNTYIMVGNVVIGHRTVEHIVRHKIS